VILDLDRFVRTGRPYWTELENLLNRVDDRRLGEMTLEESRKLYALYRRASADLGRLSAFSARSETGVYLESLVGRAYAEVHEVRRRDQKADPWAWFTKGFPQAFRRRLAAFWLSVAVTIAGCAFGSIALAIDPEAKQVIMPFSGLKGSPAERVKQEESTASSKLSHPKAGFSAELMTHNTKVSIFTMGLGLTWGLGTIISLFYNGVILGAVGFDYIHAGQTRFLLGWLLPHGSVEIPSILLAGQAGFVLAAALIGWGKRVPLRARLRESGPDLISLMFGVSILLIWAGIVEAFLSQYHEPVVPYEAKILLGLSQLGMLCYFLGRSGSEHK
jgi:uncharacterized membrane protein SpoIIM required for sporulation